MDLCFVRDTTALAWLPQPALDSHFICFDWATQQALRARGLCVSLLSDAITPALGKQLDEFVFALSFEWYRDRGADFTQLDGVSLGAIYEDMIWFQTLLPGYKHLAAVAALTERESPARIWLDTRVDSRVKETIEYLAALRALPLERITVPSKAGAADSTAHWQPWSLRAIDRLVLGAYNVVANGARLAQRGRRIRLLASYYPALGPVFDALAHDSRFEVYFLERPPAAVLRRHLGKGSRFLFPKPRRRAKGKARVAEIQTQWRRVRDQAEYRREFAWNGLDGWRVVASDLDRFFSVRLPQLAADVAAYRRAVRDHKIDMILLPFDTPPVQRMAVEVGRTMHIPSLVALHGLPGTYNRRYNCCADYFAAWGPAIIEIYKALGCSTGRMCVTGSPILDTYLPLQRRARDSMRRVLVLTNPKDYGSTRSGDDDPERYILAALDGLRDSPEFKIVVRPHPAESAAYYRALLAPLGLPNLVIQEGMPIKALLLQTDLLITPVSTVALEAMMLGIPIVWFDTSRHSSPPPFASGWIEPVKDTQTLRKLVLEPMPPRMDAERIRESFAGPMDGRASQRILDWITSLIPLGKGDG